MSEGVSEHACEGVHEQRPCIYILFKSTRNEIDELLLLSSTNNDFQRVVLVNIYILSASCVVEAWGVYPKGFREQSRGVGGTPIHTLRAI